HSLAVAEEPLEPPRLREGEARVPRTHQPADLPCIPAQGEPARRARSAPVNVASTKLDEWVEWARSKRRTTTWARSAREQTTRRQNESPSAWRRRCWTRATTATAFWSGWRRARCEATSRNPTAETGAGRTRKRSARLSTPTVGVSEASAARSFCDDAESCSNGPLPTHS